MTSRRAWPLTHALVAVAASCSPATPTPVPSHHAAAPSGAPIAPPPSASASAAQPAKRDDDPRRFAPQPIDVAKLREPATAWSVATDGSEPVRVPRGVLIIEPEGRALSMVGVVRGDQLFRTTRDGVTFSGIHASKDGAVVVVSGWAGTRATLTRVDPTKGHVVWHVPDAGGEPSLTEDGSAISESARQPCSTGLRDVATGRRIDVRFRDTLMHMHEAGSSAAGTMCRRSTWPQLARGGVSLVSHHTRGRETQLSGVATDGATKYDVEIGDAHPRLVHADAEHATLLLLGRTVVGLRIAVATGKILWRRELADEPDCNGDGHAPFHAETIHDGAARARTFFVRACGTAQLVDVASGATGWKKAIGSDVAFLSGVATKPWADDASVSASSSAAVRLFSEAGVELVRVPLPSNAHDVELLAGGLVVTSNGLDGAVMLEPSGARRWEAGVRFGNAFTRDGRFVFLESGTNNQITIDGATGATLVVRDTSPWVIGKATDLWVTTRQNPHRLVALRP